MLDSATIRPLIAVDPLRLRFPSRLRGVGVIAAYIAADPTGNYGCGLAFGSSRVRVVWLKDCLGKLVVATGVAIPLFGRYPFRYGFTFERLL